MARAFLFRAAAGDDVSKYSIFQMAIAFFFGGLPHVLAVGTFVVRKVRAVHDRLAAVESQQGVNRGFNLRLMIALFPEKREELMRFLTDEKILTGGTTEGVRQG